MQSFRKEQIASFLRDAPNDASHMQIKVVSIIAINGLLRLNELVSFYWNNISIVSVDDGSESIPNIQMSVTRSKRTGPKVL